MPANRTQTKHRKKSAQETILSTLMRRAYRRPIAKADVDGPMAFYREGRAEGDFDAGITTGAERGAHQPGVPVPRGKRPKESRRRAVSTESAISSWHRDCRSSCGAASRTMNCSTRPIRGKLSQPGELEKQARRMLADRRSFNLATNFAGQWLRLRNLDAVNPSAQSVSGLRRQPAASASGRKPSSSSTACCARIAACST